MLHIQNEAERADSILHYAEELTGMYMIMIMIHTTLHHMMHGKCTWEKVTGLYNIYTNKSPKICRNACEHVGMCVVCLCLIHVCTVIHNNVNNNVIILQFKCVMYRWHRLLWSSIFYFTV